MLTVVFRDVAGKLTSVTSVSFVATEGSAVDLLLGRPTAAQFEELKKIADPMTLKLALPGFQHVIPNVSMEDYRRVARGRLHGEIDLLPVQVRNRHNIRPDLVPNSPLQRILKGLHNAKSYFS